MTATWIVLAGRDSQQMEAAGRLCEELIEATMEPYYEHRTAAKGKGKTKSKAKSKWKGKYKGGGKGWDATSTLWSFRW